PVLEATRRLGGLPAVALLRALLFGAILLAVHALARRAGARPWPAMAAVVVSGLALISFVSERPQLFSFLLLAASVYLVTPALAGSNRALTGLGVTFVLWANLHGVAPLGVAVVAAMATGQAVTRRSFIRPALVTLVPALATLVTPYGLLTYTDAKATRTLGRQLAISEYRHPDLTQGPDVIVAVLAVLTVVALWRSDRWRRLEVMLPLGLLAVATVDAFRSAPMFVVLAGPELALGFGAIGSPSVRSRLRPHAGPLATAGAVLLGVAVIAGLRNLAHVGEVDRSEFAVAAVAAIPDGCRVLNEYEQGGYIIFARWPEVRVSQDSRADIFGTDLLRRQQSYLRDEPGADEWLRRHRVDCVLARPDRPLVHRLRTDPGWKVVVAEPAGVLIVRQHGGRDREGA
ncbi:MAG: hypothetical protein ABIW46_05985, partial [Acidimicrobiales bacterium]